MRIGSLMTGLLLGGLVLSASEPEPSLMRDMTPWKLLERAYRYLERQPAFTLEATTVNEDLVQGGVVTEVRHRIRVDLQRPGRIRVRVQGDSKNRDYLMLRGKFIVWDRQYRLYGELDTPKTVDGTLDFLYDRYGITTPLANLLYSDLHRRLKPRAKGYYFGLRLLNGVWCHYLAFDNAEKELEVWIRAEGPPRIRRFVIIDKSTKYRLHSATTIRWISMGRVEGRPFEALPPKGAHRIPIEPAK